jgi:hypothetical protein
MLVALPRWPETYLDASRRPARSVRGTYADGSGGSVCRLLWLGSVGPLLALVAAADASCKLRCNTAARGRSFDRSQRRRYNWGHNTCADEARQDIHEQRVVPALPPRYAMRMMIAPSARMMSMDPLRRRKAQKTTFFDDRQHQASTARPAHGIAAQLLVMGSQILPRSGSIACAVQRRFF